MSYQLELVIDPDLLEKQDKIIRHGIINFNERLPEQNPSVIQYMRKTMRAGSLAAVLFMPFHRQYTLMFSGLAKNSVG